MLVLSRKKQQAVVVGDRRDTSRMLKVTVLEIGNGKVRLGFEIADDVLVHRLEVWERMYAGNSTKVADSIAALSCKNAPLV